MKKVFQIEVRRAYTGRGFWLALSIGIAIALMQFWTVILPAAAELPVRVLHGTAGMEYPGVLYGVWLGTYSRCAETRLYFLILPLLAAMPFADSYFMDVKGGYIRNVYTRCKRSDYAVAKYIAVFLSAGTVTTIPLAVSFLLSTLVLPIMAPEVSSLSGIMYNYSSFAWMYYHFPLLYVLFYLLIIFVFSGLFASFAFIASRHVGYSFLVLLAPAVLYILFSMLFTIFDMKAWQPMEIVAPYFSGDARLSLLVYGIGLLVVTVFGFIPKEIKDDIF